MKNYKIEIKWAVIFVIAQLLWMVLEKSLGLYEENIAKHETFSNFFALVAFAVYIVALLDKRRTDYDGYMSYMEGFKSGVIISAIVTALVPLTQYIVSGIIAPEYFPNMIAYSVEQGILSQEAAEANFNMKSYIIQSLVFTPIAGIVTTAVVMIFIKKKRVRA
jgi:hypothetical protein